jgi:hypothetical protein
MKIKGQKMIAELLYGKAAHRANLNESSEDIKYPTYEEYLEKWKKYYKDLSRRITNQDNPWSELTGENQRNVIGANEYTDKFYEWLYENDYIMGFANAKYHMEDTVQFVKFYHDDKSVVLAQLTDGDKTGLWDVKVWEYDWDFWKMKNAFENGFKGFRVLSNYPCMHPLELWSNEYELLMNKIGMEDIDNIVLRIMKGEYDVNKKEGKGYSEKRNMEYTLKNDNGRYVATWENGETTVL